MPDDAVPGDTAHDDTGQDTSTGVGPVEALERIAYLLETASAPRYRVGAFRNAASIITSLDPEELASRAATGRLADLAGIGSTTETVVREALSGVIPAYLVKLEAELGTGPATLASGTSGDGGGAKRADFPHGEATEVAARALRQALRGDCHSHSDWSDGGSPIGVMARAARALGHEYLVLTDHSPRLTVARGLSAERLIQQLEVVADVNAELAAEATAGRAPAFRLLTGIEVDILDDGSLDQSDDLLARLDVVVASVHSKLAMDPVHMTKRLVAAVSNSHVDILGHCTGRLVTARGRPESRFDAQVVFEAATAGNTAVEINCRPERLDPPRRLLAQAVEAGCLVSIDTDAHAPGQLEWQMNGTRRAVQCGVATQSVINTWEADRLLAWAGSRSATGLGPAGGAS